MKYFLSSCDKGRMGATVFLLRLFQQKMANLLRSKKFLCHFCLPASPYTDAFPYMKTAPLSDKLLAAPCRHAQKKTAVFRHGPTKKPPSSTRWIRMPPCWKTLDFFTEKKKKTLHLCGTWMHAIATRGQNVHLEIRRVTPWYSPCHWDGQYVPQNLNHVCLGWCLPGAYDFAKC